MKSIKYFFHDIPFKAQWKKIGLRRAVFSYRPINVFLRMENDD